jgi:hypothetical protein
MTTITGQEANVGADKKALQINLDAAKYGTFAEIGAGQEVARQFFHVGGASGTIAKTISAYDMTFSDAIYGPCPRYVSRQRLQGMLDYEYKLLIERLADKRAGRTSFFVFADTVAARSYNHPNESHGWLGIRFQAHPRSEPNQIIIHLRLLDKENVQQQEALGIIGVNLIHGAFYTYQNPDHLIGSLLDNLSVERIQVDMIKFTGPDFHYIDNRLMALQLVEQGLSDAAVFTADGETVRPDELLYKKAVLVERGSFRPVTNTTLDILDRAKAKFLEQPKVAGEETVVLLEITMQNLAAWSGPSGKIDHTDFLDRVDVLGKLGYTVLISKFGEYYRLGAYLSRCTNKVIGIAMGVPSLIDLFQEKYYTNLEGGILESLGRLFKNDLKLYVYPMHDEKTGELLTVQNLKVAPNLQKLYDHLVENHFIEAVEPGKPEYLSIFSRAVLKLIQSGDSTWETMVPLEVVEMIKNGRLYGYQAPVER